MKRGRIPWWATGAVLGGLLLLSTAVPAGATIITWATPGGSTASDGLPVSAEATFTTGPGTLHIVLSNLQANPTAVSQALSDLFFTLSGHQVVGSISSSSGLERTIDANPPGPAGAPFSDGSVVATGWALINGVSGGLELCDVATGLTCTGPVVGPAHTIIGPPGGPTYVDANNSIAGNGPHNPFLAQAATFDLLIAGVTADSRVTGASFSFGTTEGDNVTGGCIRNCLPPSQTPEPATLFLLGVGVVGGALAARRRAVRGEA